MSVCPEKKNVTNSFRPLSPHRSLCKIHNGAEHLTGFSAASLRSFPGEWTRGMELPICQHSAQPRHLPHTSLKTHTTNLDTHLHSPDNSARLDTATTREKELGRTGGKGMDRSTGRVVVPFSGCAAPSPHPCWRCRVCERSAAIEEG